MKKGRTAPTVLLVFLSLFATLICFALYPTLTIAFSQLSWRSTTCLIEHSEFSENDGSPKIDVRYSYLVEDRNYASSQYELRTNVSPSSQELRSRLESLRVGTSVRCWYDPAVPSQSVINKASLGLGAFMIFPLILFSISWFGLKAMWFPRVDSPSNPSSLGSKGSQLNSSPLNSSLGIYLFFGLFIAVGLILTYVFFWNRYQAVARTKSWNVSKCLIEKADVSSHTSKDKDGKSSTSYQPEVRYSYNFSGRQYIGTTYNPAELSYGSYSDAKEIIADLTLGQESECYINPQTPFESTLDRELETEVWFGLFPLIFSFAGLLGIFYVGSQERKSFEQSSTGRYRYRSPSRIMGFFGIILVNIVWNGLVGVVGYTFLGDSGFSTGAIIPLAIITPFALIGALLLAAIPYCFLQLFNPRLEIEFSEITPVPSKEFTISWNLPSGASRANKLKMALEFQTLSVPDPNSDNPSQEQPSTVLSLDVIETNELSQLQNGTVTIKIPAEAELAHLAGDLNRSWRLSYQLSIKFYPDVLEFVPLAKLGEGSKV